MKKRILLTGGTGYLGKNLISTLNKEYDFINLGRNSTELCKNIIWNPNETIKINEEVDTIIHCAAIVGNNQINLSEYINTNIKFTSDLLDICTKNKVRNFIYISTGGVYGFKDEKFKESDPCNPSGIYNLSKKFSEDLCLLKSNEMRIVINRLFFPYGPNQQGRLFDNLIRSIIEEKKVNLNIGGAPIINPIYIDDLVKIIKLEIDGNVEGIFNICGEEQISIKNISGIINKYLNISQLEYLYTKNKVSNLLGDNEKVSKLLNYRCRSNINESIKKIIENYV